MILHLPIPFANGTVFGGKVTFRSGKINKSEIENILLNNKGWLKFNKDGTYEVKE